MFNYTPLTVKNAIVKNVLGLLTIFCINCYGDFISNMSFKIAWTEDDVIYEKDDTQRTVLTTDDLLRANVLNHPSLIGVPNKAGGVDYYFGMFYVLPDNSFVFSMDFDIPAFIYQQEKPSTYIQKWIEYREGGKCMLKYQEYKNGKIKDIGFHLPCEIISSLVSNYKLQAEMSKVKVPVGQKCSLVSPRRCKAYYDISTTGNVMKISQNSIGENTIVHIQDKSLQKLDQTEFGDMFIVKRYKEHCLFKVGKNYILQVKTSPDNFIYYKITE
jgi:hypothetical protein